MHRAIRVLILALSCIWLTQCAKGSAFNEQDLKQARLRWQQNGFNSYYLTLEISGDKVETGVFVLKIKDGRISEATRNGVQLVKPDSFYTIEGIFDFLENELELGQEPGRYFGAAPGARVYMRAHFDPQLGFPTRYLRAVTDTKHNITVEVKKLEKL